MVGFGHGPLYMSSGTNRRLSHEW